MFRNRETRGTDNDIHMKSKRYNKTCLHMCVCRAMPENATIIFQQSTRLPATPISANSISTFPKPFPKSAFADIRQLVCIKSQGSLRLVSFGRASRTRTKQSKSQQTHLLHQMGQEFPVPATSERNTTCITPRPISTPPRHYHSKLPHIHGDPSELAVL
jgi:hypothetical protein